MQNFLVINANKSTLATTADTLEQAVYLANMETEKTNHIHVVAEVKYACRTKYVEIPLDRIKNEV